MFAAVLAADLVTARDEDAVHGILVTQDALASDTV
jgi:hypothetical protein